MKKIFDIIFSTKTTAVLLIIAAISLAAATFIEDKYDTLTARHLVYNAKWFEFLLLLLVLNFIGNVGRYKLLGKRKLAGLTFHLAFILMILGAGVTRYIGFDGSMHIREGESSNVIITSEPYLQLVATDKSKTYSLDRQVNLISYRDNSFHLSLPIDNKGNIAVDYKKYIRNAVEQCKDNVAGGADMIELSYTDEEGMQNVIIKDGEAGSVGNLEIAFNNTTAKNAIKITGTDSILKVASPFGFTMSTMGGKNKDTIAKDSSVRFKENYVYNSSGTIFVFTKLYKKAKKEIVAGKTGEKGADILLTDVTYNGKTQEVPVHVSTGYVTKFQETILGDIKLDIAYGPKEIRLPFSIYLNKYILDRYPGSTSPSSFKSAVTLIDSTANLRENHEIFMNNVLDYKGYRFFQSSYDTDEKGTILSVNHDFYGTWISYIGYILLGLGFILTLLSRNSRFYTLRQQIKKVRAMRKAGMTTIVLLLFGLFNTAYSQTTFQNAVSKAEADKFGHLIVQTYDGRFEPIHTLAYDVMHKISRKDAFDIEGKGKMDGMQMFMDMMLDPTFWKGQKIIYIREKSVRDVLGITETYATFNDFFDETGAYRLASYSEKAFRKDLSVQNTFDKEIIKLDERLNIAMELFNGSSLKIFPKETSKNNEWVSWDDQSATAPLTGKMKIINDDLQLPVISYSNILLLYFREVIKATESNDYARADKILEYIDNIQRGSAAADILPSKSQVNYEMFYNKAKIFDMLRNIYGILSLVMLVLAFTENLKQKKSKLISWTLNVFIVLLSFAFIYHTFGMGLRWYLSGHAPWSNGYEALILISWGGILAGFCFLRYSRITLAATAVLAFIMLMTAGFSSYDPQLTNLQPVLKSAWLNYHVASITISYCFLGLGFMLGLINIFLYLFKTARNAGRLDMLIKELTLINEMNLEIGLALATVGTFLGGVWANEAWGRYWGWDAKETWALIIVIFYAMILHFRLIPKLKSAYVFNVSSIIAFGTVIMTFVGVNYYLSKGMHSYASDETPEFPLWAWIMIITLILLMVGAGLKERKFKTTDDNKEDIERS